jgi:hypothetical protein
MPIALQDAVAHLNWPAVLVAALLGFIIGGLWYGPLFLKPWARIVGTSEERRRAGNRPLIFTLAFVANLLTATGLALLIGGGDWKFGLFAGYLAGLAFVATSLGVIYLFEQRPLQLFLINAGYQVVNFTAMGAVLGAWH